MTPNDESDKKLATKITVSEGLCHVIISGELDWTKESPQITRCLDQVWNYSDLKVLEFDCRDLYFTNNKDGILGTYFLALITSLKERARDQHIRLIIYLKSKKQIALFNLWGKRKWRQFKRHLLFDDPD